MCPARLLSFVLYFNVIFICMKRFEERVKTDLPIEKAEEFIQNSENSHPKLRYEARPSESNNSQYVDIWCFLKPRETP